MKKNFYGSTVKIDEEVLERVRVRAQADRRTVKSTLEIAVENYLSPTPKAGGDTASNKSPKGKSR